MQKVNVLTVFSGKVLADSPVVSNRVWIGDYDRVAVLFRAASITSGNGAFTVKAGFGETADTNPTMSAYNQLIDNLTNTNVQYQVHVNGKTLSSNGDVILWMDPTSPATHLEVDLTVTTDGSYSAFVIGLTDN